MGELYDHPVFIKNSAHWVTVPGANRCESDDVSPAPPSFGEFPFVEYSKPPLISPGII